MIPSILLSFVLCGAADDAGKGYAGAVPGDLWAFVGCDDVRRTIDDWKKSDVGRFFMDASMEGARAELARQFDQMRSMITLQAGSDPIAIFEMVEGPAALVVFDGAAADPEFFTQSISIPRIGFLLGAGERAQEMSDRFAELLAKEIEEGRGVRETRDVDGVSVTVVSEKKSPEQGAGGELAYAVVGSTFVVTVQPQREGDRDEIDRLVKGLAGSLEGTLADDEDYQASLAARNPDGGGFRAYVDIGTIYREALEAGANGSFIPEKAVEVARKLGIDKLGRFALRAQVDATATDYGGELRLEGETLIGSILEQTFPAGEHRFVNLFAKDVVQAVALHLDIAAGLEAFVTALDDIDPEAATQVRTSIDQATTATFDLRRDLLAPLGDEIAFASARVKNDMEAFPGTEDDPQNYVALIEVDDGRTIETTIDTLVNEQGLDAARERREFDGKIIWSVPTPIGLRLSYSIQPDFVVLSPSAELIEDVLRRSGQHELPTLASDESFAETLAALGKGPHSVVVVGDAASDLATTSSLLTNLVGTLAGPGAASSIDKIDAAQASKFTSGRMVTVGRLGTEGLSGRGLHRSQK